MAGKLNTYGAAAAKLLFETVVEPAYEKEEGRKRTPAEAADIKRFILGVAMGETALSEMANVIPNEMVRAAAEEVIDMVGDRLRRKAEQEGPDAAMRDLTGFLKSGKRSPKQPQAPKAFQDIICDLPAWARRELDARGLILARTPHINAEWMRLRAMIAGHRDLEHLLGIKKVAEVDTDFPAEWLPELVAHPEAWDSAAMVLAMQRVFGKKDAPKPAGPTSLGDLVALGGQGAMTALGTAVLSGGGVLIDAVDHEVDKVVADATAALTATTPTTAASVPEDGGGPWLVILMTAIVVGGAFIAVLAVGC